MPNTTTASRRTIDRPSGFTLIEMLVVTLVLMVVISIVGIAVSKSRKSAAIIRVKSDFQAISMALEAFKQDFGNYPGLASVPGMVPQGHRGLAVSLIGPGPEVFPGNAAQDPRYKIPFDGVDGPGFRSAAGGKKYPAYLQADKFKVQGPFGPDGAPNTEDDTGTTDILDTFGNPIHYYPRRNLPAGDLPIAPMQPRAGPSGPPVTYIFFEGDANPYGLGLEPPPKITFKPPLAYLLNILGDLNANNVIDPVEKFWTDQPYLLLSAGADGVYPMSLGAPEKADEVYNFERQ